MSYGSSKWAEWVLEEEKALPLLKAAWDAGIQTWDTADMYSNVAGRTRIANCRECPRNLLGKQLRNTTFLARS
jgi:aryl-alcohol dehydrogenase-like predicted oxidoreductase